MENHPIPQDVTGFQFKLIGNMTVKQFGYLAIGVVLGWVFLQLPLILLIKLPISSFFALIGISLAFLPIGGRPMDLMIGNFIKALFRPTQFVYGKTGTPLFFPTKAIPANRNLKTDSALHTSSIPSHQLNIHANPVIPQLNPKPQPVVSSVSPAMPKTYHRSTGIPNNPEYPNIVVGITRDPRGNPLSNILVEIKDKEGNPVRAFKTNEVGRFASATPLTNDVYVIEFEDPQSKNKFEAKTITITGQVIAPIVATSIDTREELRRSLFSTNN